MNATDIAILSPVDDPFPPFPTRDQVCRVRSAFQGVTIHSREFGDFPAFGPETSTLADDDLRLYCDQVKAAGATHVEFDLSWQYIEPGYAYPIPGRDYSNNLPELRRRMELVIKRGMLLKLSLAMDGRSRPQNPDGTWPYNDPQGWTYGYEWGMANLRRILTYLRDEGHDLTRYTLFVPGYDGVFYGWDGDSGPDLQPQRVGDFAREFRSILPDGYVGIEHGVGHIPPGEGGGDYGPGGMMQNYDTILSEFDTNIYQDSTWQIVARLDHPYNRPADQPVGDDPPPVGWYLAAGTPRGPYFYVKYEYRTYDWVRGTVTSAQVEADRRYLEQLGPSVVC